MAVSNVNGRISRAFICATTVLISLLQLVSSNVYLHMPRGSNNRLNGAGRNRNNANRMFNSQNNNRGGYNVGHTYYYQKSPVTFEWTNGHSCADENNNCEIIIQYMCHDKLRDGSVVGTIPLNPSPCRDFDCTDDHRYGMHEHLDDYLRCKATERGNVFSAQEIYKTAWLRRLQDKARFEATYTRQNPTGARYGYECPEERDYYPYWNPSQWKDIAVLTNDVARCQYYQQESQNVKKRGYCSLPGPVHYWFTRCQSLDSSLFRSFIINQPSPHYFPAPLSQTVCEQMSYNYTSFQAWVTKLSFYRRSKCTIIVPPDDPTQTNKSKSLAAQWIEVPAHNMPAPACHEAPWSRDNHLGNGMGGQPNTFHWTVPDNVEADNCAFRIRYNISSNDYNSWNASRSDDSLENLTFGFATPAKARSRGFEFKKNPVVDIFNNANLRLRLAINTQQLGRTFQDRSHTFSIKKQPAGVGANARIHNVQVRGKRGNIVQTYPGVEYDFVPNRLAVSKGDYIHFQWTGSNTNPRNNDGQGEPGTDRHNVMLLQPAMYSEGASNRSGNVRGHFGANHPSKLSSDTILGFSRDVAEDLALLRSSGNPRGSTDSELDDMGVYFDLGLKEITQLGTYHYMCTRNNNFSNRNQKGQIIVYTEAKVTETLGATGGTIALLRAAVKIPPNVLKATSTITVSTFSPLECHRYLNQIGGAVLRMGMPLSDCVWIEPEDMVLPGGGAMTITLNITSSNLPSNVKVFGTLVRSGARSWSLASDTVVEAHTHTITFSAVHGGLYIAESTSSIHIVSIIFAVAAIGILALATAVYMYQKPDKRFYELPKALHKRLSYVMLSLQSQV
ncbi:protein DD3-3-like isoform X1 [Sycon ciliatum]|uniref:protein DD3-3-like isoform X1 n=2 Tax=Sycon ciliatum TaxID=27933 RepID=UPI0031F6F2FB